MLERAGTDLQPFVDTIHLAAVETLRSQPNPQVVATGQRALQTVIDQAGNAERTSAIVEAAKLTQTAFESVMDRSGTDQLRVGHYLVALVADLGRVIEATENGRSTKSIIEHARAISSSIPAAGGSQLIEVDLSDRDQLVRLLQSSNGDAPAAAPAAQSIDSPEFTGELARFTGLAEQLLETNDQSEIIGDLINSLVTLQEMSAASSVEHIGRVVACALRVIESHRAAATGLPLDAVEFIIACRRIIPMILDSLDDPQRVSHAIDALVDQSAFVLLELRMGMQATDELWPEPEGHVYQGIADGDVSAVVREMSAESIPVEQTDMAARVVVPELETRIDPYALTFATESLTVPEDTIRVPIERIERLIRLAGELSVRSGGYNQRSRKVLSVSQDINSIGDRLRYLVRGWQQDRYTSEQVSHHLSEITADLSLAASDLESSRHDFVAASERQANVRGRLEGAIIDLRIMPVKFLTDPIVEQIDELAHERNRSVRFVLEGGSTIVEAQHADDLTEALRQLVVNAIEHGIEPQEVRKASGKAPDGTILVKAFRDGSQTVIEVIDDGIGIDDARILQAAQDAGFPVPSRGTTRDRALQYIFLPGFTTSDDGSPNRGMGLDFVSHAVSVASGSISVRSDRGVGTVFTLRIPTAIMLLPAEIVGISSERYAIPAAEIEVISRSDVTTVEAAGGGYRAMIGEQIVPAADLGALLGVRSHHHVESEHGAFMLVDYDEERWLLRVDHVLDEQTVAFGTLAREHFHINGAVATTTLATGEPAVVLDIAQVLDSGSRRSRRFSRQTGTLARVPFALVSDDSISVRRQLSSALESEGWRVVEARDAFESRELLETIVPDLVVVDLDLPAHGGFQIIQASRKLGDMPVIGLTASDDPDLRRRADSFKVDAFATKPLDLDHFTQILARLMAQ